MFRSIQQLIKFHPKHSKQFSHQSNKLQSFGYQYLTPKPLLKIRLASSCAFSNMPPKGSKRKAGSTENTPTKRGTHSSSSRSDQNNGNDKPLKKEETSSSNEAESPASDPMPKKEAKQEDIAEDVVLREYYPPEMSNERVQAYKNGTLITPHDELAKTLKDTKSEREQVKPNKAVAHWFRWDLRLDDNTALRKAYESAKAKGVPLICLYLYSHEDHRAHITSPARVDFALRTLKIVKSDLAKLDIPLWVEDVKVRKNVHSAVLDWCQKWGVSELYANMEYEVDELRRDTKLVKAGLKKDIAVNVFHDTCVVEPGILRSGSGKTYSVFTPFFKAWEPYMYEHKILDNLSPPPEKNDSKLKAKESFKEIFNQNSLFEPSDDRKLSKKDSERLAQLWPAGEHKAKERLEHFLETGIAGYSDNRDRPDLVDGTSALSVHFAAGTLSARQAVRAARDHNKGKRLDAGHHGWVREICFRDFYKTILVVNPYVCMNKAYHEEYHQVVWEYNEEHFQRWVEGKTGFPIVDAAMRQITTNKYLHNRCRMIVASFLCKDLLLDWRKGEKYFMENLIDGDFASNNAGWQFCSSSGTDAQPYFRIFNPLLQSERFDPNGEYIRRWVPELSKVEGKAIHDPSGRLSPGEFKKLGYPEPIVEHKFARDRALDRYKSGLGRETR